MTAAAATGPGTTGRRRAVSRVVLTIEAESMGGEAIDTAVRLARAYEADLVTLFVKTSDMMNMVSLPFGATLTSRAGVTRQIDRTMLEHRLDRLAHQAEALLARAASGVRWSFRTTTGHTEQVAAREALQGDLLAISSRTATRVSDTIGALACSLLLLGDGMGQDRPVIALYEGDTSVLGVAREMARAFAKDLAVVLPHGMDARARRRAQDWLGRRGLPTRLLQFSEPDPAALAAELADLQPGLLVMGRTAAASRQLQQIFETGNRPGPLLLVS
ncbi:hypothetical protein [Emcibacter sp. SYSU 3D8]|uniref:hypothetical protein n=1 Tax=Emcibacter sp. SYSU 3D8 TaxID=3133969 RepID=UPI0031FEEC61